ncbi:MAG: hypothetical protein WC449_05920 [Candidatus Paceibacterota bacterium]
MNKLIQGLLFSGTIYDEVAFSRKVKLFFPKAEVIPWMNQTDFFATVMIDGTLNIVLRGTDGTDFKKWTSAWINNFHLSVGSNGIHDGFEESVKRIWVILKSIVMANDYDHLNIFGHSRGGAETPLLGNIIANATNRYVDCYSYGAPPSGNLMWLKTFELTRYKGLINNIYVVNPRDVITVLFRDHLTPKTDGYDVGTRFLLPEDTWQQKLFKCIPGACEHSPREYCDGLKMVFKKNKEAVSQLKAIRKVLVN